jgi:hypothetical protein
VVGTGTTVFEDERKRQTALGHSPWEPFEDEDEWQLARWLLENVNQRATKDFMKLPTVRCKPPSSFACPHLSPDAKTNPTIIHKQPHFLEES